MNNLWMSTYISRQIVVWKDIYHQNLVKELHYYSSDELNITMMAGI